MRGRYALLTATLVALMLTVVRGVVLEPVQDPATSPGSGRGELFDLKRVTDGVFAAIAKPVFKINCNALVVVLDDGVLVVDSHSKPSAARTLMDQIKSVTDQPVKYVVDTHFHWDHAQGNGAYPAAWPQGVQIISSTATRDSIEQRGIPRVKHEILALPAQIATMKAEAAAALAEGRAIDLREVKSGLRLAGG